MQRSRRTRIAFRAATVFVVLLAGIALFFISEQRRTQAEAAAVLSAYISDEVLMPSAKGFTTE
jgi:hypothetical protein